MDRYLSGCIAWFLCASAHAQAIEPPVESNPFGTIVFIVLFVGFCAGFAWMIWRNRDKEGKKE